MDAVTIAIVQPMVPGPGIFLPASAIHSVADTQPETNSVVVLQHFVRCSTTGVRAVVMLKLLWSITVVRKYVLQLELEMKR